MRLYFDALTEIGPFAHKHPAERWSLGHLQEEMVHCAIASAMVFSAQSRLYDPALGNLRLSHELANHPRLHAIWNVMPDVTDEFPSPDRLIQQMREYDVRAASISPQTNGWDLFDPASRPLFDRLQEERIPLYLSRKELPDFPTLRQLLEQWPDLPVILTGAIWSEQRFLLPILQRSRNLYITFDHYQVHYGLEDLVEKGLEDQLLFGSNAPKMSMGAHRCFVDYAEISESAKEKIAWRNLAKLLRFDTIPCPGEVPNDDAIMQAARLGIPLPCPVVDMHMHILDEGLNGGGGSYRMKNGDPKGVLHLLNRLGCHSGGFMSWNGTVCADSRQGNACTRAALDQLPETFWGLGSFDPTHYTPEQLASEIPKLYEDPRFIGMKPYHVHRVPYDSPLYAPWWEFGNKRGMYALIHRVKPDFSEVLALAERYPRVHWVVAHCGGSYAVADMAIEATRQFPNIYAEITLTPVGLGVIDYLAKGCGVDRVLYGSDLPMRDPRQQLGWVVYSRLSYEEKALILGGNAQKLIQTVRHNLAL